MSVEKIENGGVIGDAYDSITGEKVKTAGMETKAMPDNNANGAYERGYGEGYTKGYADCEASKSASDGMVLGEGDFIWAIGWHTKNTDTSECPIARVLAKDINKALKLFTAEYPSAIVTEVSVIE